MSVGPVISSGQTRYNPGDVKYKFMGFQIFMSSDKAVTERSVYGAGEMIAEIGGM
jgi:hypothetical protein